jgi:HD-GYP domain-containing protein (c-di-GMP phosphodiesterase class II)
MMKIRLSTPVEYNLVNLLLSLSRSLDFSHPGIMDHHRRVAYIALNLGIKAGLSEKELKELFKATIIHDIGAINYQDKIMLKRFEIEHPWSHCERGRDFVSGIPDFSSVAPVIYSHHDHWEGGNPSGLTGDEIPLHSRIIFLADRIDVLINNQQHILEQEKGIMQQIALLSGKLFDPELVALFAELEQQESFWLDLVSPWIDECMLKLIPPSLTSVKREHLMTLARLFARVVDARSSFTYRHSVYVGQVCGVLAKTAGLSHDDCYLLQISGLLHDLGKLAVPDNIIEKPGPLTKNEFSIMKQHSYYTYWLLSFILPDEKVPYWAGYHHERLDGNGYPFKKTASELDLPARIVAVADIFTALREDRPYRPGMNWGKITKIMQEQISSGGIDREVVGMLYDCKLKLDELWHNLQ